MKVKSAGRLALIVLLGSLLVPQSSVSAGSLKSELDCLTRNIVFEAGGETFNGKVAVAQVTLNRTKHKSFPKSVCGVVKQRSQFSWYKSKRNKRIGKKQYDENLAIAKKVMLEGHRLPKLKKALYFHATRVRPNWRKNAVAKIGNHIFY